MLKILWNKSENNQKCNLSHLSQTCIKFGRQRVAKMTWDAERRWPILVSRMRSDATGDDGGWMQHVLTASDVVDDDGKWCRWEIQSVIMVSGAIGDDGGSTSRG